MLKELVATKLDLLEYLRLGQLHLCLGLGEPSDASLAAIADEKWQSTGSVVYTLDFEGWDANVQFLNGCFVSDSVNFYGDCSLASFSRVSHDFSAGGAVKDWLVRTFRIDNEVVALYSSGCTAHYSSSEGGLNLKKISGKLLPIETLAKYYEDLAE